MSTSKTGVCKLHGQLSVKIDEVCRDVETIKHTLVGEDLRGGMVADFAELKGNMSQVLLFMDEQKENLKSLANARSSFANRKRIVLYSAVSSAAVGLIVFIATELLGGLI